VNRYQQLRASLAGLARVLLFPRTPVLDDLG